MATGELALLDANVLANAFSAVAPQHEACRRIVERARAGEIAACIAPPILFEYFSTMTNPRVTSPPLTTARAADDVDVLSRCFRVLHPPADVAERAMRIARQAKFIRQDVYDAVLAATMLANGVTRIYTVNERHFRRIPDITVLTP